jgi:uncharacterized protein (UPF0335 family)
MVRRRADFRPGFPLNTDPGQAGMAKVGGVAGDKLKSYIERIERLEEEKAALTGDIRDIYAEAKGTGFDAKVMRQIVRLRRMDSADRREQEELLDLYKRAIGL